MSQPARMVATLPETRLAKPRIALIRDLTEENWPSMDLVADMVFERLEREHAATLRGNQDLSAAPAGVSDGCPWSGPRQCFRTPTGCSIGSWITPAA